MDTLHAAYGWLEPCYWVCVAVHVVVWLYGHLKGP